MQVGAIKKKAMVYGRKYATVSMRRKAYARVLAQKLSTSMSYHKFFFGRMIDTYDSYLIKR